MSASSPVPAETGRLRSQAVRSLDPRLSVVGRTTRPGWPRFRPTPSSVMPRAVELARRIRRLPPRDRLSADYRCSGGGRHRGQGPDALGLASIPRITSHHERRARRRRPPKVAVTDRVAAPGAGEAASLSVRPQCLLLGEHLPERWCADGQARLPVTASAQTLHRDLFGLRQRVARPARCRRARHTAIRSLPDRRGRRREPSGQSTRTSRATPSPARRRQRGRPLRPGRRQALTGRSSGRRPQRSPFSRQCLRREEAVLVDLPVQGPT